MKTTAIQEQLSGIIECLAEAEAAQQALATQIASNPGNQELRNKLREKLAYARDMREEKEVLEIALAEAAKEDKSDTARQRRQRARDLVKVSVAATNARVKQAAAVDKALVQLASAMRDLIGSNENAVSAAMNYLAIAHSGDRIRHGDHALVFRGEARGESYIVPAIGRALGHALHGLEIPTNIMLRDWLCLGEGAAPNVVEKAAVKCAERYAPRIAHHLAHHIGLEEPGDEQNT